MMTILVLSSYFSHLTLTGWGSKKAPGDNKTFSLQNTSSCLNPEDEISEVGTKGRTENVTDAYFDVCKRWGDL
jgi:hypothetical protein